MRIADIFTLGYSGDRGDDRHGRDFGRDFDRRDRDRGYTGRYRW